LLIEPPPSGTALAASPFTVDSTADAVDANIGDGTCATAAGTCTLRAAVQEANALGGGTAAPPQVIEVPAGTYRLAIAGEGEDNAATGDLDIKANVTITRPNANSTVTIDASQNDRVLDIFSGYTVEIVGLSITNGHLTQAAQAGAGVQNRGRLTLDSAIVQNNLAGDSFDLSGGGIYNHQGADLTLRQVTVSGNKATGFGAGIENGGSLQAYNSTISDNETIGLSRHLGGGILNTSHGTADLRRVTLSGNGAYRGGGIYLDSGSMTLINSTISGNIADREGGAIYASSDFRIVNSTITLNTSGGAGGGACTPPCPSIYMLSGTARFRSTIIDQDALGCGQQFPSNTNFISEGFNIDGGTSCGLAMQVTLCPPALAGGDRQTVDPMLGPLADNGGFTWTHALPPSSPAVDGVPAYYAPVADQRGKPRPQFPACTRPPCFYAPCGPWADVGAYELINTGTTPQIVALGGLRPRSAKILSENLVLRVDGRGFLPGATVYWNGTPLPTEVRDSTYVEAAVKPEMFPRCGEYSITVRNPGADPSGPLSFHVGGCGRPLDGEGESR
jgi:CSLREA domain-containing protein